MLYPTVFIDFDGNIHDDGSRSATTGLMLVRDGVRYVGAGVIHGRMIFGAITDEQWDELQKTQGWSTVIVENDETEPVVEGG